MPRKDIKPIQKRGTVETTLTGSQLNHLIWGWALDDKNNPGGLGMPFVDDNERRQAWLANREWLLSLEGKPLEIFIPGFFCSNARGTWYPKGHKPAAATDYD